jgi:hypothetical protein
MQRDDDNVAKVPVFHFRLLKKFLSAGLSVASKRIYRNPKKNNGRGDDLPQDATSKSTAHVNRACLDNLSIKH